MKTQAQARRQARGTTIPSNRINLYNSNSISISSTKFFQKFEEMMFSSPKRDKSLQPTNTSKEVKEKPKDFQEEIEERYEKVSSRRSYSFPRQQGATDKPEGAEIQKTTSSDSSSASLKYATVYNLYSQNKKFHNGVIESPQIPSILLDERLKRMDQTREIKNYTSIVKAEEKEVMHKIVEESVQETNKKAIVNNGQSSYRKLVSLIEVQLNKTADPKNGETPKDIMQQNWARTWLGAISSNSSRKVNKTLAANVSGLSQNSSVIVHDNKKILNNSVDEAAIASIAHNNSTTSTTVKQKSLTRDIDKIGKSSYYLRVSSRPRQQTETGDIIKNLREARSNKMLPKQQQNSNNSDKSSFMKTLGVKNLNVSSKPVCGWDFSLLKSPSSKRGASPKMEMMPTPTMSRINFKLTDRDNSKDNSKEKIRPDPIKILDEEDQQRFFFEQTKIREKLGGTRRAKENNLSLIPDVIMEEIPEKEKESRRRKLVNSFCGSDFTKILKAGFISPVRTTAKIDLAPKRETIKSSPIQPVKKRMNSQNTTTRPSIKQEKSYQVNTNISTEHKKGQKSMEIRENSKRDLMNYSPTSKGEKPKTSQEGNKSKNYSLFVESEIKEVVKPKTAMTTVSKGAILKTLFSRVKK